MFLIAHARRYDPDEDLFVASPANGHTVTPNKLTQRRTASSTSKPRTSKKAPKRALETTSVLSAISPLDESAPPSLLNEPSSAPHRAVAPAKRARKIQMVDAGTGQLRLSGATFPLRDRIKAIGGRWEPETKSWLVSADADVAFLHDESSLGSPPPPTSRSTHALRRSDDSLFSSSSTSSSLDSCDSAYANDPSSQHEPPSSLFTGLALALGNEHVDGSSASSPSAAAAAAAVTCSYCHAVGHRRNACENLQSRELDATRRYRMCADTPDSGCTCRNDSTCALCRAACCERAVRRFCVCILCVSCQTHGPMQCHGSHD
ncbi:Hypothetical protein UVM_LOCUS276 [uncultured virus]|nr:Hypothetical protein UVM_LOCUS276 [uncultured virus]